MDSSPPGSSVHRTLQARILQWVALSFSRGSSRPRDRTSVSCIAGGFFIAEPAGNQSLVSRGPRDTDFEFGEKTCLVCLNNTLAPSSLWMGHPFLKLFLAPLHLLACNTCHYRKSVSYTVIPKRLVLACGECGVWGRGVEERVRRPVSQKAAWLSAEPTQVWVPPPQGYKCQKPESISRLFSILM